jgi:Holliday junction resolvasome RuvABC DNA-binding subunit
MDRRLKNDQEFSEIRSSKEELLKEIIKKESVSEDNVKKYDMLKEREKEAFEEWRKILGVGRRTIERDMKAIEKDIEKELDKRKRKWKVMRRDMAAKEIEILNSML